MTISNLGNLKANSSLFAVLIEFETIHQYLEGINKSDNLEEFE